MDNDIFDNSTFNDEVLPSSRAGLITQEVIFTIFVGIGIILNVTAIYTINRFKQLKIIPNLLFSNWALADTISLFATPSSYRIISLIDNITLDRRFQCAIMEVDLIFHNVALLFMIIISIDWSIAAHFHNVLKKTRRFGKCVILVIWCLAVLFSIITVRLCIRTIRHNTVVWVLISFYLLLLLCTIINQTSRCVQKCRKIESRHSTLMLSISTTYTICWFPGLVFFCFEDLFHVHPLLAFITECPIFCSSIISFVLLYKGNHDFQACLRQLLTRPKERYNENITELETCGRDNAMSSTH